MTTKRFITPEEVTAAAKRLVVEHGKDAYYFYGVPRGGVPAAFAVALAAYGQATSNIELAHMIIDDIYDSGATAARYAGTGKPFHVLFDKREPEWKDQWLVMPWEATEDHDTSAEDAITRLLQFIDDDPEREGLKETPRRVLAGWEEWSKGYKQDPSTILKTFEDGAAGVDEMVIEHNIPVYSKCEHHLADMIGIAHVGYIPNGKIVGLSKLARLVECFASRLQVQERLTTQIADALVEHVAPLGVGVMIRAAHHCMLTRGVKVHGSTTTTSAMRGVMLTKPEARSEFVSLCRMAEGRAP